MRASSFGPVPYCVTNGTPAPFPSRLELEENVEDGGEDEPDNADDAAKLEQAALTFEERGDIERLLTMIRRLPPDSKLERLRQIIGELRERGYITKAGCAVAARTRSARPARSVAQRVSASHNGGLVTTPRKPRTSAPPGLPLSTAAIPTVQLAFGVYRQPDKQAGYTAIRCSWNCPSNRPDSPSVVESPGIEPP
jgi:hypothetical protein